MRYYPPAMGRARAFPGNPRALPPRVKYPALKPYRRAPPIHGTSVRTGLSINTLIVGLMLLAVISTLTLSAGMLAHWKIHYLTNGGGFYEKLHPTTYFTVLAFFLLLIRHGNPIGELDRMFSRSKLLIAYLLCWAFLFVQVVVLKRPFTVIIDTFLLPVLLCLVMWQLTPQQKKPLVWAFHLMILLNIVIGYYEYFSGHRLIPLTLGDIVVVGEWRSSALLGHPLTASGLIAGYILALVLRPSLCPPLVVRVPLIGFSLGSLMAFGGRTALVTVLAVIGLLAARELLRMLRGGQAPLLAVIGAMCLLAAAGAVIFAALDAGIFDKMLLRFSSDKGSALARFATFDLLSHFDWHELLLGPNVARVNALQMQLGLNYGIENFWISSIAQFGIIHTTVLTLGLLGLFTEIIKRSVPAIWAIILLILMIAASSVSFSSKNIQLAQFIILITLLLPRERAFTTKPTQLRSAIKFAPVT
ncbi:VpsF family polysaccharide biosynthesis protein [Bradyrhizobium sp. SYSU BS000235]|uniref:VpsF family polysaccharide biosynthesis protein n=1 Tax=Bradyrhizobium sp. SYSU BS000235 TaxID=3411332 RepID=UPI003C79511F